MVQLTQWDFVADLDRLLVSVAHEAGPRTMSGMAEAAASLVQRSRASDPTGLQRWLDDNAETLVGQQILVANVHAQQSPAIELPLAVRAWAAQHDDQNPAEAVAWLKENRPGLLRAWLLSRVEDLIAEEMTRRYL